MQLFEDMSGFLMSISDALSVCASAPPPLLQTPPPVLNKLTVSNKKSCMFVTEVPLLCVLFPFRCLRCSSAGGSRHVIPGSKVNVSFFVCCHLCCGQVFIVASWFLGHCERACQWWDDCLFYKMLTSRGGQICLYGRFPIRSVIIIKSQKQEELPTLPPLWLSDLKTSAVKQHVEVCVKIITCPWYDLFW